MWILRLDLRGTQLTEEEAVEVAKDLEVRNFGYISIYLYSRLFAFFFFACDKVPT